MGVPNIPIPRTPAQGRLANTSSEEPQTTPLGEHITLEIPSPAPCFAKEKEKEEEEDEEDDGEGGAKIGKEGEEEEEEGRGGGRGPRWRTGTRRKQNEI